MLISCDEKTVVLRLGAGFTLTLHAPEPIGLADPNLHLEISHEGDRYVRVGKIINAVALQQMLQGLSSVSEYSKQADWAHITAEDILDLLTTKDDSPPAANQTFVACRNGGIYAGMFGSRESAAAALVMTAQGDTGPANVTAHPNLGYRWLVHNKYDQYCGMVVLDRERP